MNQVERNEKAVEIKSESEPKTCVYFVMCHIRDMEKYVDFDFISFVL